MSQVEDHDNLAQASAGGDPENGQAGANPFASFAFGGTSASLSSSSAASSSKWTGQGAGRTSLSFKRQRCREMVDSAAQQQTRAAGTTKASNRNNHKAKIRDGKVGAADGEKKIRGNAEDMASMSPTSLRALRARWRGMADSQADEEDQRFQVLVGAILSSRAQSIVVTEGLARLRAREGGLTAAAMAAVEQEELASILCSVHWNKAKSKYIREGAALILRRHGGKVPRRKSDILALPGVGPALGQILVAVFDAWECDGAADTTAASATTAHHGDKSVNPNDNNDESGAGNGDSCKGLVEGNDIGCRSGACDSPRNNVGQGVLEDAAAAAAVAGGTRGACHYSEEGKGDVVDCTGSDSDGEGRQDVCCR